MKDMRILDNEKEESEVVLEVKNLSVLIKDRFLVKNASFSINKGECWGFIGEDKSGKTSLLKAISGSLPIIPGQAFIFGKDIYDNKKVLTNVSTCFDPPVFFKYQSVYENMRYLTSLRGKLDKEKIIQVLNKFDLTHRLNTKVLLLPYFEKKLMSLALAFMYEPKLLLIDEPFNNIPEDKTKIVKEAIEEIRAKGTTVLMTSRKIENLDGECEKFVFMENREILKIMTAEECESMIELKTYAYVKVKYPHYVGTLIRDNFNLRVKLLDSRVLFDADEDTVAQIVYFLSSNKIAVYRAGYLNRKAEKIFAELTPYYKEEQA